MPVSYLQSEVMFHQSFYALNVLLFISVVIGFYYCLKKNIDALLKSMQLADVEIIDSTWRYYDWLILQPEQKPL